MAKRESWSVRSASERRRTLGRFALAYGLIFLVAAALGWVVVAVLFGLGAAGLGIAWYQTEGEPPPRPTPEWMRSIDDPDAPDLSLPEYRTDPRAATGGTEDDGPVPGDTTTDPRD